MAIIEDPEQHESAALTRLVPSFDGRRVLEIGCGDGRLTRLVSHRAASVVAVDANENDIASLRAELPAVDARAVGIRDLVLPAQSVDIAIFSWSL